MAKRRTNATRSLRNIDLTDRELLFVMAECQNGEGLILAQDVAEVLGVQRNGKRTPAGTVSTRFSWMRRYGFVDRVDPKTLGLRASDSPRWVITSEGAAVMGGSLNAATSRFLSGATAGQHVLLMREVARRAYIDGSAATAAAVRREWLHNAARRVR